MFFRSRPVIRIETERLYLRLPEMADHPAWSHQRRDSRDFLEKWEPAWARDHLTRAAFRTRVQWARRAVENDRGAPLFLFLRDGDVFLGAITLDQLRRGATQSVNLGYWIGERHARRGYMTEALTAVRGYVFETLDLSRISAACLPENQPSRALLERCGFKYEGVAQSYLQINGRWRTHVLYAALRADRRGKAPTGAHPDQPIPIG